MSRGGYGYRNPSRDGSVESHPSAFAQGRLLRKERETGGNPPATAILRDRATHLG
jgi:hypothetical protein